MKMKPKNAGNEFRLHRELMENMAVGVLLVRTADGIIVYANPAMENLFGYDTGEMAGRPISIVNAPTDKNPEEVAEAITQEIRAKGTWHGEVQNIKKDGTLFWSRADVSTFEHPQHGEVWAATHQDISEHKRMEKALIESKNQFRAIVESEPECVKLLDIDGNLLDMNPAGLAMIEADSLEQVAGASIFGLVVPEYRAAFRVLHNRVFAGESGTLEFEMEGLKGKRRIMETHAVPLRNTQGIITSLLGVTRDITERKRAEDALRTSTAKLETLICVSPLAITLLDIKGNVQLWNPAAEKIFGWTSQEVIGQPNPIVPAGKQNEYAAWSTNIMHGQALSNQEAVRQCKGGSLIEVSISSAPIFDAAGNITGRMAIVADITERKRAEENLHQREQEFKTLVEHTPDVIARFDRQCRHIYVNPAVEKEFGSQPEQLLGKSHRELGQPPEMADWSESIIRNVFQTGQEIVFELTNPTPTGKKYYLSRGVPEFTEDGSVASVLFIHHNITDRKQAEEELRQSRMTLAATLDALPDLLFELDRDGRFFDFRAPNQELLFVQPSTFLGKTIHEILPPDVAQAISRAIDHAAESGRHTGTVYTLLMPNGQRWFDLSITAKIDPVTMEERFIALARDITELKRVETQLRQAEAKYRDIFESAIEGIFQSTPDGRFINVNAAMARIFGYASPEDMITSIGNQISTRVYANPEHRANFMRELSKTGFVKEFEAENLRKDGSIIWTRTSARAIHNTDGAVLYYEGFLEDITESKHAQMELQKATDMLQTRLNEIQLLQGTLHEQATHDELTGLYNRRYLYDTVEREIARAKRDQYSISMLMIDIDHFKDFNDTYGHQAGDEVLVAISDLLRSSIRQGDIACRYGGEEFIVLMPRMDAPDAKHRAEALRKDFNNIHIHYDGGQLSASVSIGIAVYPAHGCDMETTIKAADSAMYSAKQAGRNRVHVWEGK